MVVIFAVADNEWIGVEQLLDSLEVYLECKYEVIVVDDCTRDGTYEKLKHKDVWLTRNPEKLYLWGNDLTIRRGFRSAITLFDSPMYLKVDPDTLIIGPGLFKAAEKGFSQNPKIGLLGSYRINCKGEQRDFSYWRNRMFKRYKDLGTPYRLALDNGYETGDGVLGGAYILSRECLMAINQKGWLDTHTDYKPSLNREEYISEDHLITMLAYAAGFRTMDFGGPGQPLGMSHVGLPLEPEELISQGYLVTHSMKFKDEKSLSNREYFRNCRSKHRIQKQKRS